MSILELPVELLWLGRGSELFIFRRGRVGRVLGEVHCVVLFGGHLWAPTGREGWKTGQGLWDQGLV